MFRVCGIRGPEPTDTSAMRIAVLTAVAWIALVGPPAWAGGAHACRTCGPGAAGKETPCGDTGCGPRYRGEIHEPSRCDPCDACNRWHGPHGGSQSRELLAPWQLPPGRGFQSAGQVGYDMRSACRRCGP